MSNQNATYNDALVKPPANLPVLVWLVLLGLPALLLFLIYGKGYDQDLAARQSAYLNQSQPAAVQPADTDADQDEAGENR